MKSVPENIPLSKDLFHQFLWSTKCLSLHPQLSLKSVEVQQRLEHRVKSLQRQFGKCQFVADRQVPICNRQ